MGRDFREGDGMITLSRKLRQKFSSIILPRSAELIRTDNLLSTYGGS